MKTAKCLRSLKASTEKTSNVIFGVFAIRRVSMLYGISSIISKTFHRVHVIKKLSASRLDQQIVDEAFKVENF